MRVETRQEVRVAAHGSVLGRGQRNSSTLETGVLRRDAPKGSTHDPPLSITQTLDAEAFPKSFRWPPPTAQGVSLTVGTLAAMRDAFTCGIVTFVWYIEPVAGQRLEGTRGQNKNPIDHGN